MNWNVIHIFGYGETQMLADNTSIKKANNTLRRLSAVITYLNSISKLDFGINQQNLHALHIFKDNFVDFVSVNGDRERFIYNSIDTQYIDNLASEF